MKPWIGVGFIALAIWAIVKNGDDKQKITDTDTYEEDEDYEYDDEYEEDDGWYDDDGYGWDASSQKNDRLTGGLADDYDDDDFDSDSLEEGSAVELEHTDDIDLAREIAKDHLVEDKDYYKKLATLENPGGRCLYTATINFNRGGQHHQKTMMAEAWSLSEAQQKFHTLINKNLRDATLEGLHIQRTLC